MTRSNKAPGRTRSPRQAQPPPDLPATPPEQSAATAAGPSAPPAAPASAFPIVGIGASAGGLAAFEAFFSAMPAGDECGMAFVLVQHLSPDHKSILADLVKRYTSMEVFEVRDGMQVRPDCAYIIPPNRDMALLNGTLHLLDPTEKRGLRTPIDFFFRSLAQDQHERAICVVLSGTGSDGTLGLRAVKGEGGMAMAQDPDTTEHDGMPRSAIATGLVDYVLPPAQMPAEIIAYVAHAFGRKPRPISSATPQTAEVLKKICVLLRRHTGHDFSGYKENTVVRRVERRLALHKIERPDDYLRYLQQNPAEVTALFRDLLIGVTNFFRDPDAFAVMQTLILPKLFAGKAPGDTIRFWICGCSTGEEAYSIAMLVQEQMDALKQNYQVQIFATDVDHLAIEQARIGVFPASIAADLAPERLARFFSHEPDGTYRIQKSLRDLIVFSEQDVIRDPPFSKLDMISCRNLMIYMNGDLQRKLIQLFHYALNPSGVLFLGSSEAVGEFTTHFDVTDRKWRFYTRKQNVPAVLRPLMAEAVHLAAGERKPKAALAEGEHKPSLRELTEQALLKHYVQAGVLVDRHGEVLYIHGRTGKCLEPSPGEAGMNVLQMAREGLRRELTTALHRAVTSRGRVRYPNLRVKTNGDFTAIHLTVEPVGPETVAPGLSDLFLVIFEAAPPSEEGTPAPSAERGDLLSEADKHAAYLEQELRAKDEYLQSTLEEMETSNEELKSANEELQSVNEEMQSTNEELETSKEELQSVNEELATVNAELQTKVQDLSRANNDMNNLLAGTGVATLFVDLQLRITRFTPTITQLINLIPTDIGRPVEHVVSNLIGYDRLVNDLRAVLDTLAPWEAEVQTKAGAWYLMRLRPYRTLDNVIEGGVITFVDISDRKRAEETIQDQLVLLASYEHAPIGLAVLDTDLRFLRINQTLADIIGLPAAAHIGKTIKEVMPSLAAQAASVTADILRTNQPATHLEFVGETAAAPGVKRTWVESWHPVHGQGDQIVGFSVIVQDVTVRRRAEDESARTQKGLAADLDVMNRLHAIGALFVGEGHLEPVLERVLDAAIAITRADMGNIQLFDPGSGTLTIAVQRGFDRLFLDYWGAVHIGKGACGAAMERGERVIVEDVAQSPVFAGTPALAVMMQSGARAVQSTPLMSRAGKLVGVFSTHHRTPRRPDDRELRLLDLLARQTADIIEMTHTGETLRSLAGGTAEKTETPS